MKSTTLPGAAQQSRTAFTILALLGIGILSASIAQSQNVFVANAGDNTIHQFSPTGADLGVFASSGLNHPDGIVFDSLGNLYVSNAATSGTFANTIHEFSPTGADLGTFASTGLNSPAGTDLGTFASTGLNDPLFLAISPMTPEPGSIALLLSGAIPITAFLTRRRRKSASRGASPRKA
ncbi:MAG: hypothetical protein JWN14_4962 [Chthonomonadales bacterium]|nr:hypothetical protein [Chthonomonadales bacterium]